MPASMGWRSNAVHPTTVKSAFAVVSSDLRLAAGTCRRPAKNATAATVSRPSAAAPSFPSHARQLSRANVAAAIISHIHATSGVLAPFFVLTRILPLGSDRPCGGEEHGIYLPWVGACKTCRGRGAGGEAARGSAAPHALRSAGGAESAHGKRGREWRGRFGVRWGNGEADREGRPFSDRALDLDLAAVSFDDRFDDK